MLTERARVMTAGVVGPLAETLARWGVGANALTLTGTLLHVVVMWLLAGDYALIVGACALAFAAAFDGLDGAVARHTGRTTAFGAFLDSTMDRVSETLLFLGLLARSIRIGNDNLSLLVLIALSGSLMVSYTRARSEGIDQPTIAGAFGRMERMVVLVIGLALNLPTATLAIVAVGSWATVVARVRDVARSCSAAEAVADSAGGARADVAEARSDAR